MEVTCRWCHQELTLNPDSAEARENRTDPMYQLQSHCRDCSKMNPFVHGFEIGAISHMLAFESTTDPERWRRNIAAVVDYVLRQPAGEAYKGFGIAGTDNREFPTSQNSGNGRT